VFTLGELFPTGSAIDVLSNGHLTLWRDDHEHLGALAEHEGRTYVATPLGSELGRLLRLPKATDDFGNIELLNHNRKDVHEVHEVHDVHEVHNREGVEP
jgi:hypothetical protein